MGVTPGFDFSRPAVFPDASNAIPDLPRGSILDRAVALSVELRRLGTRRRVASDAVQSDADSEMLHVSKDILESPALEDIKALDGKIRDYIGGKTVPGMSLFRAGVYLVPVAALKRIDERLEQFKVDRQMLVERFLSEYQSVATGARKKLGSLYDQGDYPAINKVRAAFGMETKYVAFSTPDTLKAISSELYQRESEKMAAAVESATEEIRQVLRASMADLVNHLVERLSNKPGQKPKVFRDSLVGNIRDFLDSFRSRNIVDDSQMAGLVDKARSLLDGVDPDLLRQDYSAREYVRQGFETVKSELDSMLVDRPTRKLRITGEDD